MSEARYPHVLEWQDIARELTPEGDHHPAPEHLLEYVESRLPAAEERPVQDHLVHCPDCARLVLELSAVSEPEEETAAPWNDERMAEVWPALRARLPTPPRAAVARRRAAERWVLPLAACFLFTTVAAGFWAWSLARRLEARAAPGINVAIRELAPLTVDAVRRDRAEVPVVPRGVEEVVLVLSLADLRPFPAYHAELIDVADGRRLWSGDGLERRADGAFTFKLSSPFPGSGRYRIRLLGGRAEGGELLAEYRVDVGEAG